MYGFDSAQRATCCRLSMRALTGAREKGEHLGALTALGVIMKMLTMPKKEPRILSRSI